LSPAQSAAIARNPEFMKLAGERIFPKPYSLGKDETRFGPGNVPVARGVQTNKMEDAAATEQGKLAGEARATLPAAIIGAKNTLKQIDDLLAHPGLPKAVGLGKLNPQVLLPATDARDFAVRFDQLKGGAFLEAYKTLKGGGAITQVEGEKATAAIARMDRSQSQGEFRKAMQDFKEAVRDGVAKIEAQTGRGGDGMSIRRIR
jgi:flagellar protein FlgJ